MPHCEEEMVECNNEKVLGESSSEVEARSRGYEWCNTGHKLFQEHHHITDAELKKTFHSEIDAAETTETHGFRNALEIKLAVAKLKALFSIAAITSQSRPTHPQGTVVRGIVKMKNDGCIPGSDFFTDGNTYPITARFSNLGSDNDSDDRSMAIRGATIKFSDHPVNSPFDLMMNTGMRVVLGKF